MSYLFIDFANAKGATLQKKYVHHTYQTFSPYVSEIWSKETNRTFQKFNVVIIPIFSLPVVSQACLNLISLLTAELLL